MLDANTLHAFAAAVEDEDGFLSMTCHDCGVSVGGDKPSDLYDVDEWAGECRPVVEADVIRVDDDTPLTHNPFAILGALGGLG